MAKNNVIRLADRRPPAASPPSYHDEAWVLTVLARLRAAHTAGTADRDTVREARECLFFLHAALASMGKDGDDALRRTRRPSSEDT